MTLSPTAWAIVSSRTRRVPLVSTTDDRGETLIPRASRGLHQGFGRIGPHIDDPRDDDARRGEFKGRSIGAVMRGDDHGPTARPDTVAMEKNARRVGQHDAGPVIVGKDERALDGARRQNHMAGADLPHPLTHGFGRDLVEMVDEAFTQPEKIMVVVAKKPGSAAAV